MSKKKRHPNVSIILINYFNYADTIECINSLNNITYPNYEIIMVDNGSTDYSQEYLRTHFPNITVIENKINQGFGIANNIGMKWCLSNSNATYFFILNNDTKVKKDTLSQLIKTAEEASDIGVVSPKIYFMDSEKTIWFAGGKFDIKRGSAKVTGFCELDNGQYDVKKEISFATGCAFVVKKSVIENIGMFDERYFLYEEDVEFSLRVTKGGYKIVYEPNAIVYHRVGASVRKSDKFSTILSPRNQRAFFYYYYLVRNRLFTMHKHASTFQWLIFLPCFIIFWGIKVLQAVIAVNYKAVGSIGRGIKDFFYQS